VTVSTSLFAKMLYEKLEPERSDADMIFVFLCIVKLPAEASTIPISTRCGFSELPRYIPFS
jgi:hypothetical protein